MIELQVINKVLREQSPRLIVLNNLNESHFVVYKDEFNFIYNHYKEFGKVPDIETFLAKFEEHQFFEVQEADAYLLKTLLEEHLYNKTVPVVNKIAELLQSDSNDAVEYLLGEVRNLSASTVIEGVDLVSQSEIRLEEFSVMREENGANIISTGLPELDQVVFGGWRPGEDVVTLMARTNQGKSWILNQFGVGAWKQGRRVGFYSGEMSPTMVGYRTDTLIGNISNEALMRGYQSVSDEYKSYIENLKKLPNPYMVVTPRELGGRATVSKICSFIEKYELDIMIIDQYSLVVDERYMRGDSPRLAYGHITDDLMDASCKYRIPIIGAVQANRAGAKDKEDEGTPELEHISESDLIAQNSTRVLSMRQTGAGLLIENKKTRYGKVGDKVIYYWDIDKGTFKYIPSSDDVLGGSKSVEVRSKFQDGENIF